MGRRGRKRRGDGSVGAVTALDSGENIAVGVDDLEEMSAEEPPGWLPDGWFMKIKEGKDGKDERYYISPVSGHTFSSELEVLHHLNIQNVASQALELVCSEYDNQHIVEQSEDSPLWLPAGWILEIRARKNGYKYKCYFDPSTRSRFYSKADVFRHLHDRKSCNFKPKRKQCITRDNVLAQIEISPDGLPSGWIKEIKFRRNASGIRKDPYYTDLMSGLVFRSRLDVNRYLESGEISRHTTRPKKISFIDMLLVEKDSPPSIAARKLKWHGTTGRRCLYSGLIPDSSGEMGQECGESYVKEPGLLLSYHDSPQSVKDDCTKLLTLSDGIKQVEALQVPALLTEKPLDLVEEKLEQDAENLSDPADEETLKLEDKKSRDPPNCKSFRPTEINPLDAMSRKAFELANVNNLEGTNGKTEKLLELVYLKLPESSSSESPKSAYRKSANEKSPDYEKLLKSANENPLEPEVKLVNEKMSDWSSGKVDEGAKEHPSGSRTKAESVKMNNSLRRSSKRLAGLKADTTYAIEIDAKSRKKPKWWLALFKANSSELSLNGGADNSKVVHVLAKEPSGKLEVKDTVVELTDPKEEPEAGNTADDVTVSTATMALPFGDSWPDPCIEFAFKTLTGDMPLFEDTSVIQDYFHQQLATDETPSYDDRSSVAYGGRIDSNQLDILTQLETTRDWSSEGERQQPGRNEKEETKNEEGEPLTM